jgi:hypothetical protein
MNIQSTCQDMCTKLGFGCEQLEGEDPIMALDTPFGFHGGDPFVVYAEYVSDGNQIRFFDAGETLFHCLCRQISSFHLRDYQVVKAAIRQPGINVTHEGEIEGTFDVSSMASGFASYIDALLSVARWEFDNAGTDFAVREPSLIHETRLYLNAMKPDMPVIKSAFKSTGVSGRHYGFDLSQGSTQIDVISCHRNASSSELYKLVDLRGNALTANMPIIVVVDDRLSPEQADREVAVISQYAEAWPMRKLIEAAAGGGLARH